MLRLPTIRLIDRATSPQDYAIKLLNGLIGWQQDAAITSTTEAKLLTLSQVAKNELLSN